ncbi:mobilization protein (plasmid) [Campylobacter lari subsp. concheus]|uniref:MobC family plasmid mobilization relaxosome protein n=1 Tax=Campylobacter lari TaxID=201 RepID=UPI002149F0F3|nr:MobC family plasmid mobilization relaxosome protein [Campylobacter lari subsp. concheus]MCR2087313.1 MobC family plasmid mobilization relaxosome protein [Campylobacter lari subsp. concheus]
MAEKENRVFKKTIRFTKSELQEIEQKAQELNVNFSQFIIYASLNKKIASKKNPMYRELITQLARVGNNLNQIAKICNRDKSINKNIASNLIITISELESTLSDISRKLSKSDDN